MDEISLVLNMLYGVYVLDYNHNHDPANGRFTSGGSVSSEERQLLERYKPGKDIVIERNNEMLEAKEV